MEQTADELRKTVSQINRQIERLRERREELLDMIPEAQRRQDEEKVKAMLKRFQAQETG